MSDEVTDDVLVVQRAAYLHVVELVVASLERYIGPH